MRKILGSGLASCIPRILPSSNLVSPPQPITPICPPTTRLSSKQTTTGALSDWQVPPPPQRFLGSNPEFSAFLRSSIIARGSDIDTRRGPAPTPTQPRHLKLNSIKLRRRLPKALERSVPTRLAAQRVERAVHRVDTRTNARVQRGLDEAKRRIDFAVGRQYTRDDGRKLFGPGID